MIRIGKKMRFLRSEKGYSQEYMAHELCMSQGNYCKLEGDVHFPSPEVIEKLTEILNISLADLMTVGTVEQMPKDGSSSMNPIVSWEDHMKLVNELFASKEKIILLQSKRIEFLERELQGQRSEDSV